MSNPSTRKCCEVKGLCVEWEGKKNHNGYGIVFINGKQLFAHRLAVALSGRNIPKHLVCDHLCRNHACINSDHIELVSPAENTMRGESLVVMFAKRDHCSQGHPYSPENLRISVDVRGRKRRDCKRCFADREYQRKRRNGVPIRRRHKYGK